MDKTHAPIVRIPTAALNSSPPTPSRLFAPGEVVDSGEIKMFQISGQHCWWNNGTYGKYQRMHSLHRWTVATTTAINQLTNQPTTHNHHCMIHVHWPRRFRWLATNDWTFPILVQSPYSCFPRSSPGISPNSIGPEKAKQWNSETVNSETRRIRCLYCWYSRCNTQPPTKNHHQHSTNNT